MNMFSVVIPLYNKGSLVKRAIDSVLSQNYPNFEIVVIDDGSVDNSSSLVKSYNDIRIRYYYKDNGGVSSARNFGIKKVVGDWVIFLDADDEMLQGVLLSYKKQIDLYPMARMHVARQDNQYESHGILQKLNMKIFGDIHKTRNPLFLHWLRFFFPCPGTVCVSKKLIFERGDFDTRLSFYEDIEFMIRLMRGTIVAYSSHLSLIYNQDDSGLSGSNHPIEKEMAYYIPEYVAGAKFWHKALLYENLEMEILWWRMHGNMEHMKYYQEIQKKYFCVIYKWLHWFRQKMIRKNII